MPDPTLTDPPDREPMPAAEVARAQAEVTDLSGRLCEAVGVDPDTNQGFRLTVFGGQVPQLEQFAIPDPESFEASLAEAMATTVLSVLPGAMDGAPPVQVRPEVLPADLVPAGVYADHLAARLLPMLADVLNGASCDREVRDWMTGTAIELAEVFTTRVYAASSAARTVADTAESAPSGKVFE